MKLLVLSLLAYTVLSGTNYYKNRGNNNKNNQYYVAKTMGSGSNRVSNSVFRNNINKHLKCEGEYCVNNKYSCKKPGDTNCYHVEHIIDINGPEYRNHPECKDISGNKIMAAGKWNTGLGGYANVDYYLAQREKELIYGSDIINTAHTNIRKCISTKLSSLITTPNSTYIDKCLGDTCSCDSDDICGCECDFEYEEFNYGYLYAILTLVGVSCIINTIGCICYIKNRRIPNYIPGFDRNSINPN